MINFGMPHYPFLPVFFQTMKIASRTKENVAAGFRLRRHWLKTCATKALIHKNYPDMNHDLCPTSHGGQCPPYRTLILKISA
jgi:hypothetical protein